MSPWFKAPSTCSIATFVCSFSQIYINYHESTFITLAAEVTFSYVSCLYFGLLVCIDHSESLINASVRNWLRILPIPPTTKATSDVQVSSSKDLSAGLSTVSVCDWVPLVWFVLMEGSRGVPGEIRCWLVIVLACLPLVIAVEPHVLSMLRIQGFTNYQTSVQIKQGWAFH